VPILAGNAAGNADAAKPEFSDRVLDLLLSEVGKLQRRRCASKHETIRDDGTELDQRLVLHLISCSAGRARRGPEMVDASARHRRTTCQCEGGGPGHRPKKRGGFERVIDKLRGVGNDAVRVHIDGLDPLPAMTTSPESMRRGREAPAPNWGGPAGNLESGK